MRPLDRVIYKGTAAQAGSFTCAVHDPRFRDSGPTENHIVVFPRSGVWIRHAGSRAFVADPHVVTIYNRGQEYTRGSLSAEGDRSDWFAVAPEVALEIAREFNRRCDDSPERPFAREFARCPSSVYLRQRRLYLRLRRSGIDALEAEESIIGLVADVIASAHGARRRIKEPNAPLESHRDLVERARAQIVSHIARHDSVSSLAAHLGTSPFHLCRVFSAGTGMTLHEYRLELRLRVLLERLSDPHAQLSRIAIELGFSSHSHLTATLRGRAGVTPSALRGILTRETRFE